MERFYKLSLVVVILLSGCAYSIRNIDVSNKSSECVRECTKSYSSCVSAGNQVGFKTETLRACKEAYEVCIETCPTE